MAKNPAIVLANPGIRSDDGLPAVDFMATPVKPPVFRKKHDTKEAKDSKLLKMSSTELQCLYTECQTQKKQKNMAKSESISQIPYWKLRPDLSTDVETAYKMRKKMMFYKRMRG